MSYTRLVFLLTICSLLHYTDSLSQVYCTPTYTEGCGTDDGINGFTLNGKVLSTASGCSQNSYQFYSQVSSNVTAGQRYGFVLNFLNTINDEFVSIWIDANKDGTFSNSELVFQTTNAVFGPYNSTLVIPTNASGSVRLRVQVRFEDIANNPCGTYTWGETEDYLLNVSGGSGCPPSQNITQNQAGGTTATFGASGNITASNVINSGANITYSSGTAVTLQPGFSSEKGSVFLAKLGGCLN